MRKRKGFTLIELLIVVAIVGILAALLIHNALAAIQKAKQKGTMKDINTIATGCMDYVTDNGTLPDHSSDIVAADNIHSGLSPFYIKVLPVNDQWGTAFKLYTGTNCNGAEGYSGITATGTDDFLVVSYGRDKAASTVAYDPANPTTVYFEMTGMASFGEDLVNWNGSWIHAPKTAQSNITP